MASLKSTPAAAPRKPYPDFPLFAHRNGQWAKKNRGRLHYFGRWDDPNAALRKYQDERDDLYAGRKPRPKSAGGLTLRDLCNQFLSAKQTLVAAGDITQRHFDDLYRGCEMVLTAFGKHRVVDDLLPDDFRQLRTKLAKKWKAASGLSRTIMGIRQIFNWAYKNELVDRPVRFGTEFSTPPKKRRRLEQNTHDRMLQPQDIRRLADDASPELRAIILLAVNCGFGNADLKTLDMSSLDLDNAWYDGARRKTCVKRTAKLWDETVDAIHKVIDKRPTPRDPDHADLLFITKYRQPWGRPDRASCPISAEFRKLLTGADLYARGRSFYSLRHCFRTAADECMDQPAIDRVMGHESEHMSTTYRHHISDSRLRAVADAVHTWLYGGDAEVVPLKRTKRA